MFLGRVVGRLWATRQAAGLAGRKMLLVRPETADGREADRLVVAVDKDIVIGIVDGHELKGR
jgi:microcompartment protein CcmK/EutM